jgi:hypothetical protein
VIYGGSRPSKAHAEPSKALPYGGRPRRKYLAPSEVRFAPELMRVVETLNALPQPSGRGRKHRWSAVSQAVAFEHGRLRALARKRGATDLAAHRAATAAIVTAGELLGLPGMSVKEVNRAARGGFIWYLSPDGRTVVIDGRRALAAYEADLAARGRKR